MQRRWIASSMMALVSLVPHPGWAQSDASEAAEEAKDAAASGAQKAQEKTETLINDALDKTSLVVDFDKGKSKLTDKQRTDLKALFAGLDVNAQNQIIYVAGFSDQKLTAADKTLGKSAVSLAEKRITAVRSALKTLKVKGDVVEVNMARHPSTVKALAGTTSAKVAQAALEQKEAEETKINEARQVIQDRGDVGKVVVFVQQ